MYKCDGCQQDIRPKPQKDAEVVPPPPWDFVLARLEIRPIPNRDGELKMSFKPEPVHYHPKLSCIRLVSFAAVVCARHATLPPLA